SNTGIGYLALTGPDVSNPLTGSGNTAAGATALSHLTTGSNNTAEGMSALFSSQTGASNTAIGFSALRSNTDGSSNTALGNNALLNSTTGGSNVALGDSAGINLTTGSNNIDIGSKGQAGESNTIRIGKNGTQTKTVIAGINGATVAGGIGVVIDGNGRLGTTTSSKRFEQSIKPMDKESKAILGLKPVTFRYNQTLDPENIPQFGLVAEDVEKIDPDLVARDEQGKPYTVR